jgi:WD40 repeat protein
LAFCHDGQFLAAAGQDGQVKIWQSSDLGAFTTYRTIDYQPEFASVWIDRLAWHPSDYLLAFNLGRQVQVWSIEKGEIIATLDFEESMVTDLTWSPDGLTLAVGGKNSVKSWDLKDLLQPPTVLELTSASMAIAWSKDSKYLASGNQDHSVVITDGTSDPWLMTGFPSKIRQLVWSDCPTKHGTPLLAVASANGVAVWIKEANEAHWQCWLLDLHQEMVRAIAFQPNSLLLATTSDDGWLCLWHEATELIQVIQQAVAFCNMAWHPQGDKLAIGSESGEIFVYSM